MSGTGVTLSRGQFSSLWRIHLCRMTREKVITGCHSIGLWPPSLADTNKYWCSRLVGIKSLSDQMDPQDADLDLEPADAAFSEPIPATMSRGCELKHETPAGPGRQSCEAAAMAETRIEEAETVSEVPEIGPETSTPLKELSPSQSEVGHLDLLPVLGTSLTNTSILAPQHTHIHYDLTGASVNIIRDSQMSETQLSLVANPSIGNVQRSQGPKGNSQPVNAPNDLSLVFAKACLDIAICLDEEGRLDRLKLVVQSCCDATTKTLLPNAHTARSVVHLFQLATEPERRMWHYLDYDFLVQLLDMVRSEKAKKILQDYDKHLLLFCEEELSALIPYNESPVKPTEVAWMEVKWKGDKATFKLRNLYECKEFLVKHLKIPRSSFVFHEAVLGCITLHWVVLDCSAHAAIEMKLSTGCIQFEFLNAEMEIKLVPPVKSVQRTTQSSNTEVVILDEAYFGNTEYYFFQPVPQHAKCPVCLGVLQDAVVSNCCCAAFCLRCYEMIRKQNGSCPLCRCADFQYSKAAYIDKHVVGNLYARCSCCEWIGCMSDAMSDAHPCVLDSQTSSEVVHEKESESLEPVDGGAQVQASVLSEPLLAKDQSDFNEKAPLELMNTLRSNIQAMQGYINDDRLSSHSGDPSLSAAAEAFHIGMDGITALLQRNEDALLAAERSIASCPDRQMPASVSELANPELDEQHSGPFPATGLGLSLAHQNAYLPFLGAMATQPMPTLISQEATAQAKLKPSTGTPLMGPLHLACWHGMHPQLRSLVDQGADINALGMFGMTPLHMAMLRGHAEIVLDLISLGADTSLLSHPDLLLSDLHVAGTSSNEALSMQLYTKANLVQEVRRVIQLAVTAGDTLLVEQLMQSTGVHPDHNTHTGQSLLFIACQQGYVKMTEKLLALGASVRFPSAFGRTPLHGASNSGSLPCLALLLEKHSEVDVHDVAGDTPLHIATRHSHAEIVRELLKQGGAVNGADNIGCTPLHFAARTGNCEIVALLHKSGASLNVKDRIGATPVHVAVSFENADAVKELLDAGANPNLPTTDLGLTPLHTAALKKEGKAIIQLLHQAKANVSARDRKSRGLLYYAVRSGSLEIVQSVVDLGCAIDEISPTKAASDHEKHASAEHESQHRDFLNADEDDLIQVSGMHSGDMSPLHLAILLGYVDIVNFLIFKGADVLTATSTGFTAIHMAVRSGNPHLIRQMAAAGCNPNQKTHDGFAPLHLAAQWGHKDAAEMLIRAGCNKEIQTGSDQKPQTLTALLIAAMNHQTDLVSTLIEEDCQVQATTGDNSNAIHLAVTGLQSAKPWKRQNRFPDPYQQFAAGCPSRRSSDICETVKLLAEHGCNINAVNSEGLTPLDLLQNMRRNLKMNAVLPFFGYDPKYAEMEELYSFMRHSKALTSHEIQRRKTLATTLSQMTANAEDIEVKLKAPQGHLPTYTQVQEQEHTDVLNRHPSLYHLTRLVVPQASRLWYEIGEHLDIHLTLLELALAHCGGDRQECCKRVFGLWLHGAGKRPILWRTVLDALRRVGEGVLADSVMQQLQNVY